MKLDYEMKVDGERELSKAFFSRVKKKSEQVVVSQASDKERQMIYEVFLRF